MKKCLLLFFIVVVAVSEMSAQFSFRIGGGYAWPMFKTETLMSPKIDSKTAATDGLVPLANISEKDSSYKPIRGSYGQGFNITFGFGYMINPYFGVDLGVSYLQSATISATQDHQLYLEDQTVGFIPTGAYLNCKISTSTNGLSLMPSIVVTGAKPGFKVYPYARLGLSMPVFGKSAYHVTVDVDSAFAHSNLVHNAPYYLGGHNVITLENEGAPSLGFNGAIGVAYKPLPYLSVFAEINGQYLTVRAKSSTITQWDADGVSRLNDRGIYRTHFNYVDELTKSSNNADYNPNYDKTKPKDDIRPSAPFSNIGFNIGLTFFLSKQIIKDSKTQKEKKKADVRASL